MSQDFDMTKNLKSFWFLGRNPSTYRNALEENETTATTTARGGTTQALFSCKKFCKIGIVSLSFVFDKYYPNMY